MRQAISSPDRGIARSSGSEMSGISAEADIEAKREKFKELLEDFSETWRNMKKSPVDWLDAFVQKWEVLGFNEQQRCAVIEDGAKTKLAVAEIRDTAFSAAEIRALLSAELRDTTISTFIRDMNKTARERLLTDNWCPSDTDFRCLKDEFIKVVRRYLEAPTTGDESRRVVSGTDGVGSEGDVEEGKGALSCEPLSEGTTPPPSFYQAGDAIDQKPIPSTSLREDVRAAALHEFDAKRVVCIYNVSEEGAVEILVLHTAGMATLFGVGLGYSIVHLREEGVVEITQLRQEVWLDRWERSNFSLVCLDCSTISALTRRSAGRALSPEHAAEQCGVGSGGGQNYVKIGEASNAPAISLAWTPGFWINLFRSRSGHGGKLVPDLIMQGGPAQGATIPFGDQQGLPQVDTATESRRQDQPLNLTVIIYLGCDCGTFYDPASKTTLKPVVTPDGDFEFFDPRTGISDPGLGGLLMVQVLTIKFRYLRGRKEMTTTLDAKFYNDSVLRIDDAPHNFGWYHDNLHSSFTCKRPLEVRTGASKVLSELDILSEDIKTSQTMLSSTVRGKGQHYEVVVGNKSTARVKAGTISHQDNTAGSSHSQESSYNQELSCLKGTNLRIQNVERLGGMGCSASIYPPWDENVVSWDDTYYKKSVGQRGIMVTVGIQIEGDSQITNEDENNLCPYEISSGRDLTFQRLSGYTKNEEERKPRGHVFWFKTKPKPKLKPRETPDVWVRIRKQKSTKDLALNHSFSHMHIGRTRVPYDLPPSSNIPFYIWQWHEIL